MRRLPVKLCCRLLYAFFLTWQHIYNMVCYLKLIKDRHSYLLHVYNTYATLIKETFFVVVESMRHYFCFRQLSRDSCRVGVCVRSVLIFLTGSTVRTLLYRTTYCTVSTSSNNDFELNSFYSTVCNLRD